MSFFDRVINSLASQDVIDLYFEMSDLIDIPITEAEMVQTALLDRLSIHNIKSKHSGRKYDITNLDDVKEIARELNIPIGKLTL